MVRMNQYFLLVHWGLIVSFTTLVITGFALKYPDAIWARPLLVLGRPLRIPRVAAPRGRPGISGHDGDSISIYLAVKPGNAGS